MARQQQRRRALSTIVGSLLFLVILVAAFSSLFAAVGFMTNYQEKSIEVADRNISQISENFTVSTNINSSCELSVSVYNRGTTAVTFAELFLVDTFPADDPVTQYEILNAVVSPGTTVDVAESSLLSPAGPITLTAGRTYQVKVVTELGTSQQKTMAAPTVCAEIPVLVGELVAAPPEIASNEEITVALVVVNRGDNDLTNVELAGGSPTHPLTVSPTSALVSQTLLTSGLESTLVPGGSMVFKWSIVLKGGIGTNVTLSTSATADGSIATGTEQTTIRITKQYTKEVVSQRLVAKPEVFMIVPSPFGEAGNSYGLWGVAVVNPTETTFTVNRIVVSLTTSITDRAERFIENDADCVTAGNMISPTTGWTCPEENIIQWSSTSGVTVNPLDVEVFLAKYQTGSLGGGGDDPAFIVSGSVFTSFGQFSKGNYISGAEQGNAGVIGNVYLTSDPDDNGVDALANAAILGSITVDTGTNQTVRAVLADFSDSTASITDGTKLIVNVPAGFTVSNVPASTNYFSSVNSTEFDDGSTQIVAILEATTDLGNGAPNAEAAVLPFDITAPIITEEHVYILYCLAQGTTSADLTVGPVAEIPILVNVP